MLCSLTEFLQVRYGLLDPSVECCGYQCLLLYRGCACPSVVVGDPGATAKSPEITFEVLESSITVPFPDHNYS